MIFTSINPEKSKRDEWIGSEEREREKKEDRKRDRVWERGRGERENIFLKAEEARAREI